MARVVIELACAIAVSILVDSARASPREFLFFLSPFFSSPSSSEEALSPSAACEGGTSATPFSSALEPTNLLKAGCRNESTPRERTGSSSSVMTSCLFFFLCCCFSAGAPARSALFTPDLPVRAVNRQRPP